MEPRQQAGVADRKPRATQTAALLLCLSALVIGVLRPRLVGQFQTVLSKADDYLLPPPEQTVASSLGYRSALADLIYAHVLVSYGIHFQEKHNFEFVGRYIDTVNALDPKFRDPYRFADTLLTIQPQPVSERSFDEARKILERGLMALPFDTELFLSAGQFMAYIAAPRFADSAKAAEWRLEGARKLSRACELNSDNENVPYHCINAATLLSDAGLESAKGRFLTKLLQVNDDPDIRAMASAVLAHSADKQLGAELDAHASRLQAVWSGDLSFVTRSALFVIGPRIDSAACAGLQSDMGVSCAPSWRGWSERQSSSESQTP